ncbi:hypothetical protein LPH56_02500 [Xylella taiwanensis]|nr:ATP-binding protein [Xylella taiwanensis]MCD8457270.1 ATP-binding protein [Xylella taiwanensis]MCD8459680.1 ATP-binding protein [Xylella taiwanensis]MCD8462520.1 ATP-binding protein [Xylella taiwanensis]UFN07370.1 hypothetical protein LPH42_03180 [Xylella taiwanensis]UFN22264.1 hypothetical protein LPH48_09535 [Xylella taiwanensis]
MTYSSHAKHAEAECDRLQQELDQHGKLKQELVMAKQIAEASVLAKSEFLATMSHEIRTALNGIIPILELIAKSELKREQRDLLQTATESSLQLLRIVDDILDYSKLEAKKLELEITTFNLRELLEGVTLLMQHVSESKRLALELSIDPTVRLLVRGDQVRLRQVLSNLIGNAIKFTERGRVDIKLRRLGENRTQHLLRFEVHDTGIGISSEQQARLFSSFSQADASTTRLYGGTGLGLAICKRIIDLMSGRIGIESQLDVGSTLWFEIPLLKVAGELNPHTNTGQRVLLVCSDSHLSQRVYQLLKTHNMDVVVTETTQESMEQLRQANALLRFDVVIGDHLSVRYIA